MKANIKCNYLIIFLSAIILFWISSYIVFIIFLPFILWWKVAVGIVFFQKNHLIRIPNVFSLMMTDIETKGSRTYRARSFISVQVIDKRSIKIDTLKNVWTFLLVYSSVPWTYIILKLFETIYSPKHMFILQIMRT